MLNNINAYGSIYNSSLSSANSSEVENVENEGSTTNASSEQVTTETQGSLYLSSRAQKINALSSEFFSAGALNFGDVDALKARAYELGLISQDEYAKLTGTDNGSDTDSIALENNTVSLTQYLADLVNRLETDEANDDEDEASEEQESQEEESELITNLIEALEQAKDIIANVEQAKTESDFNEKLQNSLSTLKETIEASPFETLPIDDRVGISKVYQTLEIVDKISPQRLTNDKLNKYLDVSLK